MFDTKPHKDHTHKPEKLMLFVYQWLSLKKKILFHFTGFGIDNRSTLSHTLVRSFLSSLRKNIAAMM